MITAIRKHLVDFTALLLIAAAGIGTAAYVLPHQRLRFPLLQSSPFTLHADFSNAQGVIPGQGQAVRVSGVQIGQIGAVKLKDGMAEVTLELDQKYRRLIHADATALLRPKTGLKDMFVEVAPGSPSAPVAGAGFTIPIANTAPDVNPDEILSVLDADTRSYLELLVNGAGQGLDRRGPDLREVFRRFEPTHRDLARVSGAVASRQASMKRLIHSLNLLDAELAGRRESLAQLVSSSSAVFAAFASEDQNISRAVRDFPGALRQTTTTLQKVDAYARVLGPAAESLRPPARALDTANHAVQPFAREGAPILQAQVRPFVRAARPLIRDLGPAAGNLATATPNLTRSITVLNALFNLLAYNPNGREGPDVKDRQEGYLFWVAWAAHQGLNLFSTGDAHGPFRPVFTAGTCQTLQYMADQTPINELAYNLTPLLSTQGVCAK
jgi:phospholipid/cholesterol/gamma-HCH transport system substrate-binding protein